MYAQFPSHAHYQNSIYSCQPTYRSQNEVDVAAKQLGNEFSFCRLHGIVAFSVVTKIQCEAVGRGSPAPHTSKFPPLEHLGERWRGVREGRDHDEWVQREM